MSAGDSGILYDDATYKSGFKNFSYTATPAAGFSFSHFAVTVTADNGGTTSTRTVTRNGTESAGTWTYSPDGRQQSANWIEDGFGIWFEYYDSDTGDPIPGWYGYVVSISVVAVFVRVPTHLLVNSSTAENPAQLVYDPATDLLVADN